MDKLVLSYGLDHHHSLLAKVSQHLGNVNVEVVVHAVEQNITEYCHASSAHSGRAVDQNRRVPVAAHGYFGGRVLSQGCHLF